MENAAGLNRSVNGSLWRTAEAAHAPIWRSAQVASVQARRRLKLVEMTEDAELPLGCRQRRSVSFFHRRMESGHIGTCSLQRGVSTLILWLLFGPIANGDDQERSHFSESKMRPH